MHRHSCHLGRPAHRTRRRDSGEPGASEATCRRRHHRRPTCLHRREQTGWEREARAGSDLIPRHCRRQGHRPLPALAEESAACRHRHHPRQEAEAGPEAPEAKEAEAGPEVPEAKGAAAGPEAPEAKEAEAGPEVPEAKEAAAGPEVPEAKEAAAGPEVPEVKEAAAGPEAPEAKEAAAA
jgi:hypothetical protein